MPVALITLCFLLIPATFAGGAERLSVRGQLSGWVEFNDETLDTTEVGARYIPEARLIQPLPDGTELDALLSIDAYSAPVMNDFEDIGDRSDIDLYRLWTRYTTGQFDARFGLQKINFGPAKLIRPLMWFDRLDVRDPLQLTDGVYGALLRYWFVDNANVWIWGLYGNDEPKGREIFGSDEHDPEFGGRCQFPVPAGEMAFSGHHRRVDKGEWNALSPIPMDDGSENRFGLEGQWDVVLGLWFEASAEELNVNEGLERWRRFLTVGADYTFESGLHVLCEHGRSTEGPSIHETDTDADLTAATLDYRYGVVDSFTAVSYYDWEESEFYWHLGWRRSYDKWRFDASVFSAAPEDRMGTFSGNGLQLMLTFNH